MSASAHTEREWRVVSAHCCGPPNVCTHHPAANTRPARYTGASDHPGDKPLCLCGPPRIMHVPAHCLPLTLIERAGAHCPRVPHEQVVAELVRHGRRRCPKVGADPGAALQAKGMVQAGVLCLQVSCICPPGVGGQLGRLCILHCWQHPFNQSPYALAAGLTSKLPSQPTYPSPTKAQAPDGTRYTLQGGSGGRVRSGPQQVQTLANCKPSSSARCQHRCTAGPLGCALTCGCKRLCSLPACAARHQPRQSTRCSRRNCTG